MSIVEIPITDSVRWNDAVRRVPDYEAFYMNEYLRAFQLQNSGEPLLIVYSNDGDYAVNAIFRRDVARCAPFAGKIEQNTYFDLSTPYGYGGFIGTITDGDALEREWNAYCVSKGYICEFVRFHLFSQYRTMFSGKTETHTHNVVRDLELPLDEMWMDFKSKVRRNVKRANQYGLEMIVDQDGEMLPDFLRIYYGTMERTNANDEFFFSEEFFRTLNEMRDNVTYFHATYQGKVISSELMLRGNENGYFYLGGTDSEYYEMRPNDFLKYEIIKWAKEHGLKRYILGGGYGSDDGIFEYKKHLAPNGIVDFWIGKKIFDPEKYEKLCAMRGIDAEAGGFFPAYRSE